MKVSNGIVQVKNALSVTQSQIFFSPYFSDAGIIGGQEKFCFQIYFKF